MAPVPQNWQPVDLQSQGAAQRLWARISTKPKMYLVANEFDADFDEDEASENAATEAKIADEASGSAPQAQVGSVAVPHDDVVLINPKTVLV